MNKETLNIHTAEYRPPCCPECSPINQHTYWRTFTETSLATAKAHNYKSPALIAESLVALELDPEFGEIFEIDREILETAGNIWATVDVTFAITMGITRAILTGEHIYCMGFQHCKHTAAAGAQGYRVITPQLYPLSHTIDDTYIAFSSGTIFTQLITEQLDQAVLFELDPIIIQRCQEIFDRYSDQLNSLSERRISKLVDFAFYELKLSYEYDVDDVLNTDILPFFITGLPVYSTQKTQEMQDAFIVLLEKQIKEHIQSEEAKRGYEKPTGLAQRLKLMIKKALGLKL